MTASQRVVASIVRPLVGALFPPSLERTASRVGRICIALAVCVAFLFPVSARAGTETSAARWITAVALLAGGLALRFSRGNPVALAGAMLALFAGAVAAPAWWLLLLAAAGAFYVASALLPRAAAPEDEAEPPATELQEILESIAMALVLALVVREFGFEAFKIPTGSMYPTILGDDSKRKGDMLLASKSAPIRRWDIAVFRYPLFRNTNYIKRIVGLPGERVEIRAPGDVYVDGVIAPKPDDVQEVLWRRTFELHADQAWDDDFDPDERNAWTLGKGSAAVDAPHDAVVWAQTRRSFAADFRASFDVEVADLRASPALLVSLEGAQRRVVLEIGADAVTATLPGAEAKPRIDGLEGLGRRFRLGLSMADRVVRIQVDGRQVWSYRHPDVTNDGLDHGRLRIGARDLKATVRDVVVENDVQYGLYDLHEWDGGGYVALGDNTGSSRDSRYWKANVVVLKDGREFVAPDTARVTEDFERDVFHERPDGGVDFIDSYAVPRSFSKDEIAEIRRNVPQPFVEPDDLVGRAFFIFFPVPPFGDFRPRFLR